MILAEHVHHQPRSEEVCLGNDVASWQSTTNNNKTESAAVLPRQPDNQNVVEVEDDDDEDDDEDSCTYAGSSDEEEEEDNANKRNWVAKRLPEIPQPSVNNQVSGSNRVNISNTNKNVYEGNVVIHQTFYNNADAVDPLPMAKITIDKDTEACNDGAAATEAVGPKLSNVSSHPLYPFKHDEVSSWCTKRRLIVVSGVVLTGIAIISLIVYFSTSGEPDILGVPYVDRRKWIAQPPQQSAAKLQESPPPYVIISHTATEPCNSRGDCIYTVRYIQNFHIESKGWDDIGYNFLVGGDGAIYEGRGWDVEGAHTFNYNKRSIGISFIGTFTKKEPSEQQLFAARKLIEYALQSGKLHKDYKLLGHRQCIKTESPGEVLYNIIKTWPHWSPTP